MSFVTFYNLTDVCVYACVFELPKKLHDDADQRDLDGCEFYLDVIAVYSITLYSGGALLRLSACH